VKCPNRYQSMGALFYI